MILARFFFPLYYLRIPSTSLLLHSLFLDQVLLEVHTLWNAGIDLYVSSMSGEAA